MSPPTERRGPRDEAPPSTQHATTAQPQGTAHLPRPHRTLDAATVKLLREGGPDGSRTAFQLALRFVNAGRGWDEYRGAMTDPTNGAARWYAQLRDGRPGNGEHRRKSPRGPLRAERELRRCWDKAVRLPAPRRPDVSDVAALGERVLAAGDVLLTGRAGSTRRKVLAAVVRIGVRHATGRPMLAVRTVALEAGVSPDTAARSLRHLVQVGLLQSLGASDQRTRVFALRAPSVPSSYRPAPLYGVRSLYEHGTADCDIWRHSQLGATGFALWSALSSDELSTAQAAAAAGVGRTTAYRRLPALAELGLAVEVEDGRWIRGTVDPARVLAQDPWGCHPTRRDHDAAVYALQRTQHRWRTKTVLGSRPTPPVPARHRLSTPAARRWAA